MKRKQRLLCGALAASMIIGVCVHPAADMQAAKKASLAKKKITVQVGNKKSITIKNKVKKAVYKFKASSKLIKVSKKGVITAKKAGTAKVTVSETYKKKTRKLGTVTVTITDKTRKATQKPAGTAAPDQPGTTVNPVTTTNPSASVNPTTTTNPAATTNPSASVNPAASDTPAPANTPEVSKEPAVSPDPEASLIYRNMFEDGNLNGFQANGGRIEISNSISHGGINSLLCTDRANVGDGAEMDISDMVMTGRVCQFSAWVMQDSGQEERISMELSYKDADGNAQYMSLVYGAPDGQACPSGEWVHLSGVYEMPAGSTELMLTITSPTSATADLYIDDVEIYGKKEFAEDEFPMTNEVRDDMTAKSILSTGNNAKIKNVIEKARAGQDVTLAYIGGSITEGGGIDNTKCYARVSSSAFAETYGTNGGSNVHFINAGMSGTPSSLGVIRYERDVLDRVEYGDHPDILFIEFSVNDYQEVTNCGAYEGLIRRALKEDTAVVMIFSVFHEHNVVYQPEHSPLGKHYSVPMVSLGNATEDYYKKPGFYNWYYNDQYHPNPNGYQLMSDCIMRLFDEIDHEEKKEDIDIDDIEPMKTDAYEGIKYLDAATDISKDEAIKGIEIGGFTGTDKSTGVFQYEYNGELNAAWFPNNWMHTGDAPLTPWKITVNCRTFMLIYKLSNNASLSGKADLYVDGEKKKTIDSYDKGGWNNGSVCVAFTEKEAAEHTIELVMADGDEAKSFTLSAVGYK